VDSLSLLKPSLLIVVSRIVKGIEIQLKGYISEKIKNVVLLF